MLQLLGRLLVDFVLTLNSGRYKRECVIVRGYCDLSALRKAQFIVFYLIVPVYSCDLKVNPKSVE